MLTATAGNRQVGIWAVSTLATDAGGWRSINRVALPMIHPLFTQYNEDLGNRLNAGRPLDDFATYGETVIKAIAGAVAAYGTSENPRAYAEKVAHRLFPNILAYEIGTSAVFGFAAWNGRSRTDNAPDVMFSLAANTPIRLGIGKESVTSKPSGTFAYVPAVLAKCRHGLGTLLVRFGVREPCSRFHSPQTSSVRPAQLRRVNQGVAVCGGESLVCGSRLQPRHCCLAINWALAPEDPVPDFSVSVLRSRCPGSVGEPGSWS